MYPSPAGRGQPARIELCHVEQLDLPENAVANHLAQHPDDFLADDGSCIPTPPFEIYQEGCPCFNQGDVDDFLDFLTQAVAATPPPDCNYLEFGVSFIIATVNDDDLGGQTLFIIPDTDLLTICRFQKRRPTLTSETFTRASVTRSATYYETEFPDCGPLIASLKEDIRGMGCRIFEN